MNTRLGAIFITIMLISSAILTGCEGLSTKEQITVTPSEIKCNQEGGRFSITVTPAKDWTVSNVPEWISVMDKIDSVIIDITPNKGFERECSLTFDNSYSTATLSIFQESTGMIATSTDHIDAGHSEESFSIDIECYRPWYLECSHEWIKADAYSGDSPLTVNILISENMGYQDREGYVSVISGDTSATISIRQSKGPVLEVEKDIVEIDGDGGIIQVLYMSDEDVEVVSECDWIRIISNGSNIKMLAFEISRNLSEKREGKIRLSLKKHPEIVREILVRQGAKISHPALSFQEGNKMDISSMDDIRLHPIFEDMTDLSLSWSSDYPDIASVEAGGLVHIHNSGRCTITAYSASHGVKASIELNIRIKATSMTIYLNGQDMSTDPVAVRYSGEVMNAGIIMNPPEAYSEDIIFYIDDDEIAKMEGRTIRCLKPGKTAIRTESVYQKLQVQFTLIVLNP